MRRFAARARIAVADRRALYRPGTIPALCGAAAVGPPPRRWHGDDPRAAWWAATLAHLAYLDPARAATTARHHGLELVAVWERSGIRAYALRHEHQRMVAFCGTRPNEIDNLRQDLDCRRRPHPLGGQVHRGFADALDHIALDVERWLADGGRSLLFTGHSLGAALAFLAAARWPCALATGFGAPRIGDRRFVTAMPQSARCWRFQHGCDVVGHLPPAATGFVHLGHLRFLSPRGVLLADPPPAVLYRHQRWASWRYLLALPALHRDTVLVRSLADHAIPNYTAFLHAVSCGRGRRPAI